MNAVKQYISGTFRALRAGTKSLVNLQPRASRNAASLFRVEKRPDISTKFCATLLLAAVSGVASGLHGQTPTPTPTFFYEWTGAADSNFLNPNNWIYSGGTPAPGTPSVPDGPTAAVYLPLNAQNKVLNYTYDGTGTKRFTFYSMQTGDSKAYTINFSGNQNGWLEINPIVKGFASNGSLANAQDPNYNGASNNNTRIPMYVVLNSYTRLTLDNSYNSIIRTQNGLNQGLFTLHGNAEMDVSRMGSAGSFVRTDGTNYTHTGTAVEIGGILVTDPGTRIYMGTLQITLQNNVGSGDYTNWGGLIEWDTTTTNASGQLVSATRTHSFRGAITTVAATGRVICPGTIWLRGGDTQYVVNGRHDGPIRVGDNNGATLGGSGVINGNITVQRGGWINPATRGTATAVGQRLTINGNVDLNGGLQFDLVAADEIDRLVINGNLNIPAISTTANPILSVFLNEDTFPMGPGQYDLLTVNGNITGNFVSSNVQWSVGPLLSPSWRWVGNTLRVSFVQLPFSGAAAAYPKMRPVYGTILDRIDQVANAGVIGTGLFAKLNRAKAQYQFENILYQLTPNTYQAWYPSAYVRTNSIIQTLQDQETQDAAYKRKKGSVQTFLQGYRQESSRDQDELASYSNYGTMASVAGVDYAFGENFVAGGFVASEWSDSNLDTDGGKSDMESNTFGLKARFNTGKFHYNLLGFYGSDDYKSKRSVAATGLGTWATSKTSGSRYGAAGSMAYTLNIPWFEVTPAGSMQWLNWQADGFQEISGNDANLYVHGQDKMSVQSKVGVRLARSFETKRGYIRPFFHCAWMHEFYDGKRSIDAELFGGLGGRIGVRVPGIDTDGYRMDLGLDWSVTNKLRLDVRYTSESGGAADESVGVRGGINYSF